MKPLLRALWPRKRSRRPPPANKGQRYPADHLLPEEVQAMLNVLDTRRVTDIRTRALIGVLWGSGLRIAEALSLRPHDVNAERRTVRVRDGKGHKPRTAAITVSGLRLLEPWLAMRAEWGLPKTAPVFCTSGGRPLWAGNIRKQLPEVARKAGVERRVHPHIFRHTYAVELANRGVPPHHIQRLLGHSNLGTTDAYLKSLNPRDSLEYVHDLDW